LIYLQIKKRKSLKKPQKILKEKIRKRSKKKKRQTNQNSVWIGWKKIISS
jgi:hypothetical protein